MPELDRRLTIHIGAEGTGTGRAYVEGRVLTYQVWCQRRAADSVLDLGSGVSRTEYGREYRVRFMSALEGINPALVTVQEPGSDLDPLAVARVWESAKHQRRRFHVLKVEDLP